MTSQRKIHALLALVLAASFALRAWDASHGLNASRYFDERFNFKNVAGLLVEGEIRPQHAFYPTLAYLPQTAVLAVSQGLHRLTGIAALAVFGPTADGFTPTAYWLSRMTNAVFGVLSLWLVFLVGRRIWGPEVGLLAAAILGAFARHILASVEFKPDVLVILLTLLTFWWTLDAAEEPSRKRYLLVGLGVGLTAAAKYTGAVACLPLVALALWKGPRDRRHLAWLLGAGLASIVTFVALNPWLGMVRRYFWNLVHGYAAAGLEEKSDRWVVFTRQIEFLIEHHGAFVAVFLAIGLVALVWRLVRAGMETKERTGTVLALAMLLGHSVLHSLVMTLFRGQNYLPVVPFSSLVAAWALVAGWKWLAAARPVVVVPLTTLFLAGVAGSQVTRQLEIVYQRVVPTNWAVANRAWIAEAEPELLHLRHVAYERALGDFSVGLSPRRPIVSRADRLSRLGMGLLDLTDAEVFPLARRDDAEANFYGARQARVALPQVEVVAARPFRSRDEAVVVVRHPWRPVGEPVPLALVRAETAQQVVAALPALPSGTVAQIELWVPKRNARLALRELRLDPGGLAVPLFDTGRRLSRFYRVTPRFVLAGDEVRLRLAVPPDADLDGWAANLRTWIP